VIQIGASEKVATAFANQPTAETRATNPLATAIINHANKDNTVPASWLLGMNWIESKLNPNAPRPIGPNGQPLSSADGGWQITDDMKRAFFGDDKKNWNKVYDPAASTEAAGSFLSRAYTQMKEKGTGKEPGALLHQMIVY
jgi:Transglycosylase SLT domain